jgi:hypothetical protein
MSVEPYGGNGKRVASAIAPSPFLAKVLGVAEAGILALFLMLYDLEDYSCGTAPDFNRLPPLTPEFSFSG